MAIAVDRDFIVTTLQELVRINSVNPDLDPSGPGEAAIGDYVEQLCRGLGLEVHRHEPQPGRVSVVARLAGHGGGRSLMLNAHYDTVGVAEMPEPFSGAVREGRLYGRGSYDMKGSLAACLGAAKALEDSGRRPAGDLLIAAVADEEVASLGTADLLRHYRPDAAIVTEPTALQLCRAHKGFVWLQVTTQGRAAHGSQFDQGIDANLHMGRVLAALAHLEAELRRRPAHPLVGPPSLHAATLAGGSGMSTYAASCRLGIERRTIPGETTAQVVAEVQALLAPLRTADPNFHADLEVLLDRPPFEVAAGSPIVQALETAATGILGSPPPHVGENPWMDSALLAAAGIDTVVFGPAGAGAHAKEEWVELESVVQLAEVLAEATLGYCGGS